MIQSDRRKTYPDVSVGSYAAKGGVNVMMLVIALKVTVVLWGKEGGGCRTDSSLHHPDNSEGVGISSCPYFVELHHLDRAFSRYITRPNSVEVVGYGEESSRV